MLTPFLTAAGEAAFKELIHLISVAGGLTAAAYIITYLIWGGDE